MKRNRRNSAGLLVALFAAGAAGLPSCTDFSDRMAPAIDCTVGEEYDIDTSGIDNFEADECTWYGVPDGTGTVDCDSPVALHGEDNIHKETVISMGGDGPVATEVNDGFCDGPRYSQANSACEAVPEGPRCGSDNALHLTGSRNTDWGGFFGNYSIAKVPRSVAGWDGLAFWARTEPGAERSFTIELDDKYTTNVKDDAGELNTDYESACVDEEQQGNSQVTNTAGISQSSGQVAGWVPSEDGCGNPYEYQLTLTTSWELYIVPFDGFSQKPLPNRRLQGFDRKSLRGIRIRAPKDSIVDVWIDDLGLYKKR